MSHLEEAIPEIAANIEETILELIASLTGRQVESSVSINGLRDFGIDSLGIYQVICEVEQRHGISVPDSALQNENATIRELALEIQAQLQCAS